MVNVSGFEPIFSVTDVERAAAHYRALGFETSNHDETYAFAHCDQDLTIHLAHANDPRPSTLYLHVRDADQLAAQWREAGFDVTGPDDVDYGKREGAHIDPDGNLIRFGSPLQR